MSNENNVSRRDFIRKAATAAAIGGSAAATTKTAHASEVYKRILPQTVMGANEKIRTGHIGVGGMGKRNMQFVLERDDMQPIMVCDLVDLHLEQSADMTQYSRHNYARPTETKHFEEVIANPDVDAVVITTPDHWHAIPAIMAAYAGKDVWCEKPLGTTIPEGRAIVKAVEETGVVFQGGNFQRSGEHFQKVVEIVKSGHIGEIARVETWIHDQDPIAGMGEKPGTEPPEGVDWERYLGWTPHVPFNENRFLYHFRWFLDYSGGKMTDWGAHLIDIVMWAMGEWDHPNTVTASGGNYIIQDNRTTPDTLDVLYEFDDYVLSFENRVWCPVPAGNRYGIRFYGTLGILYVDRMGYEVIPHRANGGCEPLKLDGQQEGPMNIAHWQNFADCVRSRERCICDAPIIHASTNICHAGTAAWVGGGKFAWDGEKEQFSHGESEALKKANAFINRPYENGWSLEAPYHPDLRG